MSGKFRLAIRLLYLMVIVVFIAAACRASHSVVPVAMSPTTSLPPVNVTPATRVMSDTELATATPIVDLLPLAENTAMPVEAGELPEPCGVLLRPVPQAAVTESAPIRLSEAAGDALQSQVPSTAWPALDRLLDAPGSVALVAYQTGRESEGIYLNSDMAMPLASVAKVIVSLAELERYYLPNFDLGAHRRAVDDLGEKGRILTPDDDPAVLLSDVARMMVEYSSNAAADYLQLRLGQTRIEETAIALGMNDAPASHSAPCVFLGQFLMMANHIRTTGDQALLTSVARGDSDVAAAFGQELAVLADTYINQADFRQAEQEWRAETRRPSLNVQRYFAGNLAPQGTAGAYAALMLRLAQNGLSNADSSYQARLILEWPNQFPANQELFSNVGYKNGSLPGVLTTAYYAYRWGDAAPVVVILFYRDLPQQTYRQWRYDLPHDELARWLLADPAAIPALATALRVAKGP
ncbi:MAG: hypothetical protein DCC51_09290 [Anaerolineae bacterium]|nr:MAG: hypothetical protein DCC51_09290 [Anaerolineae bacterium]